MVEAEPGAPSGGPVLSIILAILNERASLPELFSRLRTVELPSWEAIVVDDGSTDGSREFVRGLARSDPRIRLILHEGRQTTVGAQCAAIGAAQGTFVAVMDSDLQHPPELLAPMVAHLQGGAALVVASRYAPGGSPGARPPLRAVISRVAEWTAQVVLPPARRTTDPVSGFFAFRRAVFSPLARGQRGYKLLLFVLVMSRDLELREVPFRFEPRTQGASKVTTGLAFVRLFLTEVVLARRLSRRLGRSAPSGAGAARS